MKRNNISLVTSTVILLKHTEFHQSRGRRKVMAALPESLNYDFVAFNKGMERMVLFEESNQDFFTIEAALKLVEM